MRHPDSDFLYGEEMPAWQDEGRLAQLVTAVSRGARPHYVQDALRGEAAEVARLIRDGARVMVCGGRDMAARRRRRDGRNARTRWAHARGAEGGGAVCRRCLLNWCATL